ncbi:hypothetical protein AX13_00015 [Comamonas aquatica DA1877]|uniref:Uncharacterized protein n=1 Tax=Comamonas aquatica DA1877 TaxID=1457173 RepID=A0A014NR03_9BURK|nr:hypothetical protein AX13_00015 [Comamonas aquatica DA1877]
MPASTINLIHSYKPILFELDLNRPLALAIAVVLIQAALSSS